MPVVVYVGNLPANADRSHLCNIAEKYGDLHGISIKSGFAFVQFKSLEAAQRMVADNGSLSIEDTVLKVEMSSSRNKNSNKSSAEEKQSLTCSNCGKDSHQKRNCPELKKKRQ